MMLTGLTAIAIGTLLFKWAMGSGEYTITWKGSNLVTPTVLLDQSRISVKGKLNPDGHILVDQATGVNRYVSEDPTILYLTLAGLVWVWLMVPLMVMNVPANKRANSLFMSEKPPPRSVFTGKLPDGVYSVDAQGWLGSHRVGAGVVVRGVFTHAGM